MAKRRVGNPLFNTQEPEQFVNLQEPSFLDDFSDGIPEVEGLEGIGGSVQPPEMSQEMPQSLQTQDARQIPLPPEEPSFLDSIGQYFTKGLQTVGDARYPEQDDLMPEDYAGLENFAEPEEQQQTGIEPGQDMYSQGYKAYADKMENLPPYQPDLSENGMNFARAMGGELPPQEDPETDEMEALGYLAEGQQELQQADQEVQDPEFVEKVMSGQPPVKPEVTEQEVEQRAQTEGEPVSGAVAAAKNNPYIMNELKRLNGIGEMPDELMQFAQEWEDVLTKNKELLSEREKSLQDKLQTGELSDFDKLGIALAVAIPIVMGLMYGGSAFALAGAGVLEGYAGMKSNEAKQRSKTSEGLEGVAKDQLKLAEDAVKMKQSIVDKIPNKDAKRFIRGRELNTFGDDVGISAGDENRTLWINTSKIHDDEDVKKMRERTKEAEELIGGVSNFNEALTGVQEITAAIQDQAPGLMNILRNNYKVLETTSPDQITNSSLGDILSLLGKIPGVAQEPVMIEIMDKDGKVTKVNGLDALQQSVKALQNDYNTAVLKGSRLTENVMKHWSGIMFDPTSISQFLSSGVEGWVENSNNLRNIMNRKIQEELVGYGFIRQPIQEAFPVSERTILRPVSAVNRDISKNPDAYKNKVR